VSVHAGSPLEASRKTRRPPLLQGVCMLFPGFSSFSVLRGAPMLNAAGLFKKLKCYIEWSTGALEYWGTAPVPQADETCRFAPIFHLPIAGFVVTP
jgi:hypothetical protein